jgi:hypothetical protein
MVAGPTVHAIPDTLHEKPLPPDYHDIGSLKLYIPLKASGFPHSVCTLVETLIYFFSQPLKELRFIIVWR